MRGGKWGFFWVLEPHLREAVFWGKVRKTRELGLLANEVHWRQHGQCGQPQQQGSAIRVSNTGQQFEATRGGREMSRQLSVETAVCTEHERLTEECQRALENWDEHRAEFCRTRPIRQEAGDELLRLQAKYARAHTVLQRHVHDCLLCQMVAGAAGPDAENSSEVCFESIL